MNKRLGQRRDLGHMADLDAVAGDHRGARADGAPRNHGFRFIAHRLEHTPPRAASAIFDCCLAGGIRLCSAVTLGGAARCLRCGDMKEVHKMMRRVGPAIALAAAALLALANTALGNVALTQISSDPFTNSTAVDGVAIYHATQVEPDTFSSGSTIVSTFQVGRFHNGGADDIGFATSTNGGKTWKHGLLPGLTFQVDPTSPYERVSDASVAFDAKHNVWMISSIPLTSS